MKYIRASNGYFYKVTEKGKKTRISRAEYMKKKFNVVENPKTKRKTNRRSSRRRSSTRKTSRRRSRKGPKYSSPLERRCKMYLQRKIKENIKEYEAGKYVSRAQAIAVSYSQTFKKHPDCDKIFQRRK